MIKINLLPSNIYEARTIKRLIVLFVVVLLVVVAGGIGYTMKLNKDTAEMKAQADTVEQLSKQVDSLKGQAQSTRSGIAPVQDRINFFKAVQDYNLQYPKLYEDLAQFTYAKIIYSQLTPSGSTLNINAYAPSLSDAGRYLLNLYKATHIFSSVTISAVPGYPQDGGGQQGALGPAGMPLMPGAMPGMPGMAGPGLPPPIPGMAPPADTGYGGLEAITSGVTRAAERKKGFSFTVTCTLKAPIAAPSTPGQAAAAAGGMPGAMPGMMPGAMPGPPMPGAPGAVAAPAPPSSGGGRGG